MLYDMDLLIDVNDECILNGVRESPSNCPIALAVDKAIQAKGVQPYDITVDGDIVVDNLHWDTPLPEDRTLIYDFINNFDNGKEVKPFKMLVSLRQMEREDDDRD